MSHARRPLTVNVGPLSGCEVSMPPATSHCGMERPEPMFRVGGPKSRVMIARISAAFFPWIFALSAAIGAGNSGGRASLFVSRFAGFGAGSDAAALACPALRKSDAIQINDAQASMRAVIRELTIRGAGCCTFSK